MRYDAVIFDLDGTLLNTLDDLAAAVNAALASCGYPPRTLDEVRAFVGNGVAKLIGRAVPAGTAPEEEERCLDRFRAHYLVHMRDQTAPYPGILSLLDALQQAGIAVAVVSNKFDAAVKELCRDYFGPRVPVALGESPSVRKKPAPDTVFAALRALDLPADRAVYVGGLRCGYPDRPQCRHRLYLGLLGFPGPCVPARPRRVLHRRYASDPGLPPPYAMIR